MGTMEHDIGVERSGGKHVVWPWVLTAAAGATVVYVPIIVYSPDFDSLLYVFVIAPIIALILLISATIRKRNRRATLLMLVAYAVVTAVLFSNYGELRPALRWLLWSPRYKAELQASPNPPNGQLKHVEWDVSGWGPVGPTIDYLVFDPTNSLSAAAKSHRPGHYNGLPCEVPHVQRLESHWYEVLFYTEESWGGRNRLDCTGARK